MSPPDDEGWPREKLLAEEDRRVLYLQGLVDSAILRIMNARLPRSEALALVNRVRSLAGEIFPDALGTFDLLYLGRFRRAIEEFTEDDSG